MQARHGCSLWVRDSCGGGGKSVAGDQVSFAAMQMRSFIAGKMTSCLQPTDTDFSFRLKAFASAEGRKLRQDMQAARVQAVAEGADDEDLATWGNRELLEVVHRSLQRLQAVEEKENLTLKSLCRNGFLAWRPDMQTRTLYDCRRDDWMKDLPQPMENHRLYSGWLEDRWSWCKDGVPEKPSETSCVEGVDGCAAADKIPHDWDWSTMPGPHECRLVSGLEGTTIEGPVEKNAKGKCSSQVQCVLGDFSFGEAVKADYERLLDSQCRFRDRLHMVKVPEDMKKEYKRRVQQRRLKRWVRTLVVGKHCRMYCVGIIS